jgi:hypothetical protein
MMIEKDVTGEPLSTGMLTHLLDEFTSDPRTHPRTHGNPGRRPSVYLIGRNSDWQEFALDPERRPAEMKKLVGEALFGVLLILSVPAVGRYCGGSSMRQACMESSGGMTGMGCGILMGSGLCGGMGWR